MNSRTALRTFMALAGLVLAFRFGPLWYSRPGNLIPLDWNVYWIAVERLLSGQAFYGVHEIKPFKYSPTFLYAFRASFFLLEKHLSVAIWMAFSALSFFAAYGLLADGLIARTSSERESRIMVIGAIVAVLLSWHGFVETLSYGQTELFFGAGLLALMSGRLGPWARATIWAFFFSMKPHMGLILLVSAAGLGIAEGALELARAFAATTIVYLLPALWLGPSRAFELLLEWVRSVQGQHDLSLFLWNTNQSVPAALARVLHAPGFFFPLTAVGIAGALLWAALKSRKRDPLTQIGFGTLTYLAFAPLSWRWFIVLWPLPILAILARTPNSWPRLFPWALLALLTIAPFSSLLGLQEGDRLSELGFHAWATFALFVAGASSLSDSGRPA